MANLFRRCGGAIAQFFASAANPPPVADCALLFSKTVDGVTQMFTEPSNGNVYGLTPGLSAGPIISPAALGAGTTNNYAPTGAANAAVIRQDCSGAVTLTGLDATAFGGDGRRVTIINISATVANVLTLTSEAGTSTAANRFTLPNAANVIVPSGGSVTVMYDATSSRWRVVATGTNIFTGTVITPSALAANQNNWNPTGLAGASIIRLGYGAGFTVTGMVAQPNGTEVTIQSIRSTASPEYLTFANESASSTAANRFALPQGNAWYLPPNASFTFRYDGTLSRWVLKSFATTSFPESNAVGGSALTVGYPVENIGLRRDGSQILGMLAGASSRQTWNGSGSDPSPNVVPSVAYFENQGQLRWSGVVAIGPLTGTINNQALTDVTLTARITTSGTTTLTGLTGGQAGRVVTLVNASANDIVLNSEDAGSTAANRFLLNAASITVLPEGTVQLWYDTTSSRWRKLS